MGMTLDRFLTVLGRFFVGAGILVFLFVAFQLWGTGLSEARSQNELKSQLADDLPVVSPPPAKETPNTTPAPPPAPTGSAVAIIKIPKINLEKAIVEGTGVEDLKKGPGHYLNTPLPGQPGNAAIAGHRTTYGAPFGDLGELSPGDEIDVTTRQGSFRYVMTEQKVVSPNQVDVLDSTSDNRLTLTTCHPKYSAAKRLVIIAKLDNRPAPAPTTTTITTPPPNSQTETSAAVANGDLVGATLSGTSADKLPAIMWGIATAVIGMLVWVASQVWRRWLAYLLGTPLFLVFLFVFFENFSRLLPANA
jgi:sortase A